MKCETEGVNYIHLSININYILVIFSVRTKTSTDKYDKNVYNF